MADAEPEVATLEIDQREFLSTYFALRVGLVASCALVLMAPLIARRIEGDWPPSISDSFYTDARTVFIIGLAAGAAMLIAIRGDTLTEQTLLNTAGWLGLAVAGVACRPKDGNHEPISFDPDVVAMNQYAIWAVLGLATLLWLIGVLFLPAALVGTGWHVTRRAQRVLFWSMPALLAVVWFIFLADQTGAAERVHGPAAALMFILLGCTALLRTTWGVKILRLLGDTPVDGTVSKVKRSATAPPPPDRYDWIYTTVAVGMIGVVVWLVVLKTNDEPPGYILGIEAALLLLFGAFWVAQTIESWKSVVRVEDSAPSAKHRATAAAQLPDGEQQDHE